MNPVTETFVKNQRSSIYFRQVRSTRTHSSKTKGAVFTFEKPVSG